MTDKNIDVGILAKDWKWMSFTPYYCTSTNHFFY